MEVLSRPCGLQRCVCWTEMSAEGIADQGRLQETLGSAPWAQPALEARGADPLGSGCWRSGVVTHNLPGMLGLLAGWDLPHGAADSVLPCQPGSCCYCSPCPCVPKPQWGCRRLCVAPCLPQHEMMLQGGEKELSTWKGTQLRWGSLSLWPSKCHKLPFKA